MPSADPWDEAWDAYEARRQAATAGTAPAEPVIGAAPRPAPGRPRGRRALRHGLRAAVACALLMLAAPGLQLAGLVLRHDAAGLLAALPAEGAVLRLGPMVNPAAGAAGGASRFYLEGLAGELASGARDPAAVARLLESRRLAAPPVREPVAGQAETVRLAWPLGWNAARLELLPREGGGGLALDLAWRPGGWEIRQVVLRTGAG